MSRDDGSATAELAIVLPAVALMCGALLATGQAVINEVRCTDAARAGARLAARGDGGAAVAAEAARRAPPGAVVAVSRSATQVQVMVRAPLGGLVRGWTGLSVSGAATASVEDAGEGGR